jgi:antitoxin ParD1/3/4
MPNLTRRTVTLAQSQSDYIDAKIASGVYVSASEVVRAGIAALAEREAALERWLEKEVIPAYEASKADPSRVKTSDETFAELRRHMADVLSKAAA